MLGNQAHSLDSQEPLTYWHIKQRVGRMAKKTTKGRNPPNAENHQGQNPAGALSPSVPLDRADLLRRVIFAQRKRDGTRAMRDPLGRRGLPLILEMGQVRR